MSSVRTKGASSTVLLLLLLLTRVLVHGCHTSAVIKMFPYLLSTE